MKNVKYEAGKQIELLGKEFICNRLRIRNWLTSYGIHWVEEFDGLDHWKHWSYPVTPELVDALNSYCKTNELNIEYRQV